MKFKKHFETILLSNNKFEVRIQKKIFGGYSFKKYIGNSPFDILESREVRLNISEEEAIGLGKEMLNKVYKTTEISDNINLSY